MLIKGHTNYRTGVLGWIKGRKQAESQQAPSLLPIYAVGSAALWSYLPAMMVCILRPWPDTNHSFLKLLLLHFSHPNNKSNCQVANEMSEFPGSLGCRQVWSGCSGDVSVARSLSLWLTFLFLGFCQHDCSYFLTLVLLLVLQISVGGDVCLPNSIPWPLIELLVVSRLETSCHG